MGRMMKLIYAPTEMIYWIWHTTHEKKENYFASTFDKSFISEYDKDMTRGG